MPIGRLPPQRITDARYTLIGTTPALGAAYGLLPSVGPAVQNVLDTYTWNLAFDARFADVASATWPASYGVGTLGEPTAGWTVTPQVGQSTAGLVDAAIGAARVDQALLCDDTDPQTNGFNSAAVDDVILPNAQTAHFRLLFDGASAVPDGNNATLFEFLYNATYFVRLVYVTLNAGNHQLSAQVRHDGSGGTAGGASTTVLIPASGLGGLVLDMVARDVGGVTRVDVLWNGNEEVGSPHDALLNIGVDGLAANAGVFCNRVGSQCVPWRGVFFGARMGTELSLAEHQADATALGV